MSDIQIPAGFRVCTFEEAPKDDKGNHLGLLKIDGCGFGFWNYSNRRRITWLCPDIKPIEACHVCGGTDWGEFLDTPMCANCEQLKRGSSAQLLEQLVEVCDSNWQDGNSWGDNLRGGNPDEIALMKEVDARINTGPCDCDARGKVGKLHRFSCASQGRIQFPATQNKDGAFKVTIPGESK